MLGWGSYVFSHDQFQGKFRQVSSQNRISVTGRTESCTWTHNPSWALSVSCILPGNEDSPMRTELMRLEMKENPSEVCLSRLRHAGAWTRVRWASREWRLRECGSFFTEKRQGSRKCFAGSFFCVERCLRGTFFLSESHPLIFSLDN